ncbi:hypothetical protein M3Y98_00768800 [Aphelenchoides besseyi]|nr:hypothetical protein M3Y98_00768800 [Aphelenchoides besseyi]KAI6211715.1 hypothetical protein M3Y96_00463600 [Aphelenchoides besseyi]
MPKIKTDPRMVRQAKHCFDEGELKDFQDDIDYFMETLNSPDATANLKCLSMINLTKKCAVFEFRKYLRGKLPLFQKLITTLKESHETPALSICVAAFLYMMARDAAQFPSIGAPLSLIYEFLKQDKVNGDSEYQKYQKMAWEIINTWKKDCEKRKGRKIIFDLTEKNMTPAYVSLVTLDYIVARSPTKNQALQSELLNTGILQSLNPTEETIRQHLSELEHSFRIFENGIMLDKRNQTFVVGHRQGSLLFSCEKYLDYFCKEVPNHEIGDNVARQLFDCLSLMIRATMNASHSNEVCAIKLGQIGNFLSNSLHVLSSIIPRFAEKEKLFDLTLLICGLLVNLTEKSASNRRKVSNLRCEFFAPILEEKKPAADSKQPTPNSSQASSTNGSDSSPQKRECNGPEQLSVLEMLTRVFCRHEEQARSVDEELDNEMFEEVLEEEEAEGEGSGDENGATSAANAAGRLTRAPDLNDDEIVSALNSAMQKATAHMHDSMIASYVALLIGCLVQTDETMGDKLRALMPAGNFATLLEQLDRFREFTVLTKIVDVRCIESIIESLKILDH